MPERGGDAAIAPLGVHRIPVPIPFPQAGGPVNVVAVEEAGGGIALFDTGLGTREAEAALVQGLAHRGWGYTDVRRIFVTHGHVDHFGLAEKIRAASGATIHVHDADRDKVTGPSRWEERTPLYRAFLLQAGASADQVDLLVEAAIRASEAFSRRIAAPVERLHEGQRLTFARCTATILEMPGHTPGLICAQLAAPRGPTVLLADDHLLEKVSPNPLLELRDDGTRFRALPTYFQSLGRVETLEIDWVLPGHGAPFPEPGAVIGGLRAFYARRQEKLLSLLPQEGATPVELVRGLFPRAQPMDLYLMIGEVLGNLDLLEAAGRVTCSLEAGLLRYRASP